MCSSITFLFISFHLHSLLCHLPLQGSFGPKTLPCRWCTHLGAKPVTGVAFLRCPRSGNRTLLPPYRWGIVAQLYSHLNSCILWRLYKTPFHRSLQCFHRGLYSKHLLEKRPAPPPIRRQVIIMTVIMVGVLVNKFHKMFFCWIFLLQCIVFV